MGNTAYTAEGVTRLDLLGGRLRAAMPPLRPPWALPEPAFLDVCTGCDDCIDSCPTAILKKSRGGYPVVDFSNSGCTFCGDCVSMCRPKALARQADHRPWTLLAVVAPSCLSAKGTMCRMCGDRCDAQAIGFKLALGGKADPNVDPARCTGCGACIAPCPVDAIAMISQVSEG